MTVDFPRKSFKNNHEDLINIFMTNFKLLVTELIEEAAKCSGPTKKTSSDRKGKKWMIFPN
ncbi:MAG: hypothetical protein EB166_08280, partial [Thaumarchaeota archaeon]|nr:hypothetical protein [Nitrososphaerota archaeon]